MKWRCIVNLRPCKWGIEPRGHVRRVSFWQYRSWLCPVPVPVSRLQRSSIVRMILSNMKKTLPPWGKGLYIFFR